MQKAPVSLGTRVPCFRAEAGAVLLFGEMDLSEFTHVVVTYSVKETFEPDSAGFPACIGLKTAGKPYSRGDAGYDAEDSLALALPEGGPRGLKYERQLILDLSDVDYKGEVYLAACIPEKAVRLHTQSALLYGQNHRDGNRCNADGDRTGNGRVCLRSRYRPSGRFGVSRNRTQRCRLYFVGSDRCSRDSDSDRHRAGAVPPQKAPRRTVARFHKNLLEYFRIFHKVAIAYRGDL